MARHFGQLPLPLGRAIVALPKLALGLQTPIVRLAGAFERELDGPIARELGVELAFGLLLPTSSGEAVALGGLLGGADATADEIVWRRIARETAADEAASSVRAEEPIRRTTSRRPASC